MAGFVGIARWLRLDGQGNRIWTGMEFSIPYNMVTREGNNEKNTLTRENLDFNEYLVLPLTLGPSHNISTWLCRPMGPTPSSGRHF